MKLNLGVMDIPYSGSRGTSTGDVAEILEAKYHVFETFFQQHEAEIVALLEVGMADALENALMGAPGTPNWGGAEAAIGTLFRAWLSSGGMDGLAPGVPTKAATRGVSHRRKRPYARRGPRPSFIDTGLFEQSMLAWMEGNLGLGSASGGAAGAGEAGAGAAFETAAEDVAEVL